MEWLIAGIVMSLVGSAVSALTGALLAKKRKSSTGGSADDIKVPEAKTSGAIPELIGGETWLSNPNCIKTGGRSYWRANKKPKQHYYYDTQWLLCLGGHYGVSCSQVWFGRKGYGRIDERWERRFHLYYTEGSVNLRELFGGDEKGGGIAGGMVWSDGKLGRGGEEPVGYLHWVYSYFYGQPAYIIPKYRGRATITFYSEWYGGAWKGRPFYIGTSPTYPEMSFRCCPAPDLEIEDALQRPGLWVHSDIILEDPYRGANPAYCILVILIRKAALPFEMIDWDSFREAYDTLKKEWLILSVALDSNPSVEEVIREICDITRGFVATDPNSGKVYYKLARGGYDISKLPHFDEYVISEFEYSASQTDGLVNTVHIKFSDHWRFGDEGVAIASNPALLDAQGGIVVSEKDYKSIKLRGVADSVAAWELELTSTPLLAISFKIPLENLGKFRIGDVVIVSSKADNIAQIAVRITEITVPKLSDESISVSGMEDIFLSQFTLHEGVPALDLRRTNHTPPKVYAITTPKGLTGESLFVSWAVDNNDYPRTVIAKQPQWNIGATNSEEIPFTGRASAVKVAAALPYGADDTPVIVAHSGERNGWYYFPENGGGVFIYGETRETGKFTWWTHGRLGSDMREVAAGEIALYVDDGHKQPTRLFGSANPIKITLKFAWDGAETETEVSAARRVWEGEGGGTEFVGLSYYESGECDYTADKNGVCLMPRPDNVGINGVWRSNAPLGEQECELWVRDRYAKLPVIEIGSGNKLFRSRELFIRLWEWGMADGEIATYTIGGRGSKLTVRLKADSRIGRDFRWSFNLPKVLP